MQVKKITDLDVAGKRVFIRADLNVPQDEAGNITEDTRIRASIPSINYCLDNGAAVMVTSHLGRPSEGTVGPDDTLLPRWRFASATPRQTRPLDYRLGRRGFELAPGQVVLLENCRCNVGEEGQRGTGQEDGRAVRCPLRERRIWHRPPCRGNHPRHRPLCTRRLRRNPHGRRDRCIEQGHREPREAAGGDRRRRQGVHQADDSQDAGRESRPVDRRWRHRQHLPARGRQTHR